MKVLKELRDQLAHFVVGFAATFLIQLFLPVLIAASAVMVGAVFREQRQHPAKKLWQLGWGSMLDLLVIALGAGLAIALVLLKII